MSLGGLSTPVNVASPQHSSSFFREEAIFREVRLLCAGLLSRFTFRILFQGYQRGFGDALAKADSEVERQARAAFALAALDDEVERSRALEATLSRLQSSRYK